VFAVYVSVDPRDAVYPIGILCSLLFVDGSTLWIG